MLLLAIILKRDNNEVMKVNQRSGFTLLELLVIIAIMGILTTLVLPNYLNSLKRGRDSKRKSDMQSIQHAMEQYYQMCNFVYPVIGVKGTAFPATIATNPANCTGAFSFTVPKDPLSGSYVCEATNGCTESDYTVCPPGSIANRLESEDCSTLNCCLSQQQ